MIAEELSSRTEPFSPAAETTPEGVEESSRGLRSAATTPPEPRCTPPDPGGVALCLLRTGFPAQRRTAGPTTVQQWHSEDCHRLGDLGVSRNHLIRMWLRLDTTTAYDLVRPVDLPSWAEYICIFFSANAGCSNCLSLARDSHAQRRILEAEAHWGSV